MWLFGPDQTRPADHLDPTRPAHPSKFSDSIRPDPRKVVVNTVNQVSELLRLFLYICSPSFGEKNNRQADQSTMTTPEATAGATCTNILHNKTTIGESYEIITNSNDPRINSVYKACLRDLVVRSQCLFVVVVGVVVVVVV